MVVLAFAGRAAAWTVEAVVIALWVVLLAPVWPFVLAYRLAHKRWRWFRAWELRRRLRALQPGKEVSRWLGPDEWEDLMVVSISRADDELVGVRRRRYGAADRTGPRPDYADAIEYMSAWEVPTTDVIPVVREGIR